MFVLLPINAPLEYWDDSVQAALFVAFSLRYFIVINIAWLVNSAHFIWGLDKNKKQSDSNMVFIVTRSYWPQYHYLLPWDYQTGEFGNYGECLTNLVLNKNTLIKKKISGAGITTAFIRVCAAVGEAEDLQTMTTDAVKKGLSMAVDTGRPVVECLKEAGMEEMCHLQKEHYLQKERLK